MKRAFASVAISTLMLSGLVMLSTAGRSQVQDGAAAVRFEALDVVIDSAEPLAAWQFELTERSGRMTVVGVEGGDSEVFADPPYYDLAAVERGEADRLIVADFTVGAAGASLPVGRTRVATIHVRVSGAGEPDYRINLTAAGDAAGQPVDAAIAVDEQAGG